MAQLTFDGPRLLRQGATYTRLIWFDAAGQTLTVVIGKAGGAFGALAGSVAEVANGWYAITLAAGDTDTVGDLAYHITAASGGPLDLVDVVVPWLGAAGVIVGTVNDKSGYALSGAGLDAVSPPADVTGDADARSKLTKMIRAIFNYLYNDTRATAAQLTVRDDSGVVRSTMALSNDGTTQTKGKSA